MQRIPAHVKGSLAEWLACLCLIGKGYHVIDKNKQIGGVEVDIIAIKARTVVVVEVKYRPSIVKAHVAIHPSQVDRLKRAATYLSAKYKHHTIRVDAIFISKMYPFIIHLKDVFSR